MHTTMSDGVLSPEEAVNLYRKAGYDFVAITDHRSMNPEWSDGSFLVMTGAEYDTGDPIGRTPVYHILGIGMRSEPRIRYGERRGFRSDSWPDPQELIDAIHETGGEAILAHPAWSVMTPEEMMRLHGFLGAEIFNSVSGYPFNPGRDEASYYWDIWAKNGKLVNAIAGDDSHYYEGEHTKAFTMVNAPALHRDAIMEALQRGSFYASTGPRFHSIDLDTDTNTVTVECSRDVRAVVFKSNTPWPDDAYCEIGGAGRASYRLQYEDRYVRVELIGAPSHWTLSTRCVSNARLPAMLSRSSKLPLPPAPKDRSGPAAINRTDSCRASTFSANAAGSVSAVSRSNGSSISRPTPACASRYRFSSRVVSTLSCPVNHASGEGSNVSTAGVSPSDSRAASAERIFRCPRCTPSNLPIESARGISL